MNLKRLLSLLGALAVVAALSAPPARAQTVKTSDVWTSQGRVAAGLSVSNSSSRVLLSTPGQVLWACNTGSAAAYLALGTSTVTATATGSSLLPAGQCGAYDLVPFAGTTYTYVAAITAASTTTLYLETGAGSPPGQGVAGSGGGGSSVTVTSASYASCTALCANQVVKATPGTLYSFEVTADSTLAAAAWWILVYDATSAPTDGAVTPAKCYSLPLGTLTYGGTLGSGGVSFVTGITIGVSTTGCFTKTASTHAMISGDYQ